MNTNALTLGIFLYALPAAAQETFRDCADCPQMIVIPAGKFTMGSTPATLAFEKVPEATAKRESPAHRVNVDRSFAMGTNEVTRDQFSVFAASADWPEGKSCLSVDENGARADVLGATWKNPGIAQNGQHPVVCVDFGDVVAYVAWLSNHTGYSYRLPSEAEWEYAARAGTTSPYFWAEGRKDACTYANVPNSKFSGSDARPGTVFDCDDGYAETAPVGSFSPNNFGLHDMLGNVWEWVEDCWHPNYSGSPGDNKAWTTEADCNIRVVRGGGWGASQTAARSAARSADPVIYRGAGLGFRVVRDIEQ